MTEKSGLHVAGGPRIATSLDPDQVDRLRRHPGGPAVMPYAKGTPVWNVPRDAEILMTYSGGWVTAPREKPSGWPYNLKWVQIASAGIDAFPEWIFDVEMVTNGRGVSSIAIAEYVVGAIFAHEKRMFDGLLARSANEWTRRNIGSVSGKSVGFYGYGSIARTTAGMLAALGMTVHATRRGGGGDELEGVRFVASVAELAATVDHLVVAVPLTAVTRRSVDAAVLAQAKRGLHLINISRGEIVEDTALLAAIDTGKVSAATLDVTAPEPLPAAHPFYGHPRIRLTPHISWMSEDNADRLAEKLHANLDRFLAGEALEDLIPKGRGY